jgi:hypothetical protein
MAVTLTENDGILEVRVTGKLTDEDYQQFVPAFESLANRHGKIRLLFEMVDFHGWTAVALWDDVKFDMAHFSAIERLAFVGDARWERGMALFCQPFTTATIRFFESAAIQEARDWLSSEP